MMPQLCGNGDNQPPKNIIAVSAPIKIMKIYSARKNRANAKPEYSTWCPATISDSPSATSNGARLVSATAEIKYTKNTGNNVNQFPERIEPPAIPVACAATISLKFKLPENIYQSDWIIVFFPIKVNFTAKQVTQYIPVFATK
mgnify:CR=1 FL=1